MNQSVNNILNWVLRIVPAVIIGRAAFMKLTADPSAVALFKSLDMEPGGRILIGVIELIAVVLLLSSRVSAWGGLLGLGVMCGAVIAHTTVIGFDQQLGILFAMAMVSTVACTLLLFRLRHQVPFIQSMFDH